MRTVALRASALAALLAAACAANRGVCVAPGAAADDGHRRVVMISIDGLMPALLRNPDAYGLRIPNLRRLIALGSLAEGVIPVWPTVTFPAHATLVTGVRPARHGIVNNSPFDPLAQNQGGWFWYASDLRARTLWDAARAAGLITAQSYWPVTVGAAVDFSFPQMWRAKTDEDDKLLYSLATPGVRDEVRERYGALPTEHRTDKERADAAELLLETRRPHLTLVYFTDLDTEEHLSGPSSPKSLEVLERIDAQVGRVVAATRRAGTFERTAFVVVSDHGMLPTHSLVQPAVLLRQAGILDVDAQGRVGGWRAQVWKAGGICALMLRDPADALTRAKLREIFELAAKEPRNGIARIHEGAEIAKHGGFPGAALVLEAAAGFGFGEGFGGELVVPNPDKGTHGYPPTHPEMRASLLLAGAGVKKGAALGLVDMIDIAPTVARLLGVELPDAEGKPLAAVLVRP